MRFTRLGRHAAAVVTAALVASALGAAPAQAGGKKPLKTKSLAAVLPNDRAFQLLVKDITKPRRLPSGKKAFTAVAGLGINTVESVLLYHVVPGATVTKKRR